ncbi:MAG: hypothetical protein HC831_13120 [Chloroflexia bacterium]|nr:hypothetical protein [Chloroflexia bacterium]
MVNYASEKLGVQWKIIDFNKRSSFNYSNKGYDYKGYSPIINNWHLIGYISGLLYQVDFLNSSSEAFKTPLLGISTGITFFNGLDLNVGYAFPFEKSINKGLLTFSFDIKITEYLSKIRGK